MSPSLRATRQATGRLSWGIADQAVSSLTNLAVALLVARSLGTKGLGAFSIAFATYQVALNASRGLATDPLVVRYSGVDIVSWRHAVARATGMATTVGMLLGACCGVTGLLLDDSTGVALLALGVSLPGLLLQDSWRFAFFSNARGGQAFANDLVWGLTLIPLLAAVVASEPSAVHWFILAWGGSSTFAAATGVIQAGVVPRFGQLRSWLRQHHDLALRYLGENLSVSGAYQLRAYGIGVIAGLAAVGSLRAAELLLGPFNVLMMGTNMIAVPQAVQVAHRSVRTLRRFCVLLASVLAGAAIGWCGVLLLLLPEHLGVRLLGSSWRPASELLLPVALSVAGIGLSVGASAGLRALGAASRSLCAQLVASVAYVLGGVLGATMAGATGAAWGTAVATTIGSAVWWWQLHRALQKLPSRAAPTYAA